MANCVTASNDLEKVTDTPITANTDKSKEILYCGEPKCSKIVPEIGDSIFCDFCNKWFHLSCTEVEKDTFQFLTNAHPSIFWKCSICPPIEEILNVHQNFKNFEKTLTTKIDKIETNISKKINLAYKAKTDSSNSPSITHKPEQRSISNNTVELQADIPSVNTCATKTFNNNAPVQQDEGYSSKVNRKPLQKICNHYKMGTCRHGASGKKLVNNKECMYSHPFKCKDYCRFGPDGCDGTCGLMHPILCSDSLKFRECFNVNCTFAHLQGTQRYKTANYSQPYTKNSSFSNTHFKTRTVNRVPVPLSHYGRQSLPNNSQARNQHRFTQYDSDFPPLPTNKDGKLDEITHIIKQMQGSIDYLMKESKSSTNSAPSHQTSHQHPSAFQHFNVPNSQPSNQYTQEEAKNYLPYNQSFPQ